METMMLAFEIWMAVGALLFVLWLVSVAIGSAVMVRQRRSHFARNYRVGGALK